MNTRRVIIYMIGVLAFIGLFSLVLKSPFTLLKTLLTFIVFASIIIFLFNLLLKSRTNSKEMKQYKRALKQSKKRYNIANTHKPKRKRPSYLRVIDGNKGK